jgi:hypothetical protein
VEIDQQMNELLFNEKKIMTQLVACRTFETGYGVTVWAVWAFAMDFGRGAHFFLDL